MTAKICDALKEVLQIPGDKVYVKYQGTDQWGWNGRNF
jgi:2C-methyl-D-erythritol 2,4-cyclodiphosphate synthase